ncbi:RNA polymerase sigma factor [Ferranicluibacter rubi]|uniref:RNA polymerase sigma factor n=1 Tax=Ferranicluibacter rubi TaxID=2715133 RepID=A0AA43ZFZ5_9HYPH|nr:RNA polymerase sigma factor [Ferranicluibacter rubi]NHT77143.1 RNA polymerase sigma factor [Ferranicluibacter rubi]TCP82818.1 RNA polymerase sigma-70 factor (ECF subfamily) [Rhizobium sp. PP-CC-2G-626]TCQ20047.1 RNA polymerase sigma-70 factor (ECF subfamily) [Rhizobium sp. PP-CC-3G-465]
MTMNIARLLNSFVHLKPQLLATARRRRADHSLAEDLLQDAWIKLQTAVPQQTIENLAGYIHRTVSNTTVDHLRGDKRRRDINAEVQGILRGEAEERSPERAVMARQTLAAVAATLDAMPERSRRIFLLSRLDGLTHKRIAEREGISEEAVYYHIRRVLENLAVLRGDIEA